MPGKLRAFIAICLIWAASCFLFGAYLRFQPVMLNQPDGSKLDLYASGDEFYNWLHDKNGYTVKQNDAGWYVYLDKKNTDELVFTPYVVGRDNPATMGLVPWTNISSERMGEIRKQAVTRLRLSDSGRAPSTGTLNNLSIFIRFSDQSEYTQNISTYSSMFNGTTGNTMQSYFLEASYNALNIQTAFFPTPATTVVSWQDSHPRGYYSPYSSSNPIGYNGDTERTNREFTLLVNAVNGVRSQIPTSLNLDGDSDGLVDNVCFIIQGGTDGWAELLWPHRWSIYDRYVYINGKRVYDFNFQLSTYLVASSGVGVLCHEMFHSLGAPDLYHYDHDGLSPVGSWDLMENNGNPPQHMSAYMKYKYGHWISSIPELTTNGTYTLNPLTSATNNCYKIPSPNSSSEFFVVEYRRDTGTFESSLPGSGMLVYRINPNYEGNADGPPDEVYLYRPGGTSTVNGTINSANYSQETSRTAINSTTNPTPFLTDGSASGLNINSIGSAGATISFVLDNPIPGQPNCQITGPTDGSGFAVNSTVTVNVTATDTNGTISNVKFYIDDVLKYTDSAAPYTWNWSTTGYAAGSHAIKAIATDNSSNTATSVVNVVLLAPADEGFETGDFSAFAWNNTSSVPWTVQTAEKFSGTYAAKSGTIGNSASTTLSLPMPVSASGNISFYYKVSSESGYDVLKFYINGVQQGSWSGTEGWALATYPVSAGSRTFTWTYSKDGSVSSGSDCAWLDHIIFPPTPAIEVNPISLAFGRVRINTTTTNTFQISNQGSATLSGTITTPTGYSVASGRDAGSDEFVLRTAKKDGNIRNSLGYNIPAGGSRTFTVTFAPTAVQAYNGNITITHNAGGANKTVALTGQGGKSTIGLNAMSFTATLAPGASSNQTLTVSNSGNLSLNYSLTENGTVPWLTLNGGSSVSNTIAAGGNAQNITIGFNATGLALGTYNASISGTSNDPNQPTFSIPVTMNLYDPNTAPQINLPDQFAIAMNGELTVDFSAYVSDADNDELWLTYVESAHVTVGLNGLMVTFTPSVGWTGTEELSFTVHDGTTEATDVVQVVVSQVISSLDTPVLTIIRNAGATRLQWEAIDNASEYWIFRANDPYGAYSQIGTTSNPQFTDDTVLPKAFYQVKAVYIPVAK
jgi:M6 family metalloprotease-like protein